MEAVLKTIFILFSSNIGVLEDQPPWRCLEVSQTVQEILEGKDVTVKVVEDKWKIVNGGAYFSVGDVRKGVLSVRICNGRWQLKKRRMRLILLHELGHLHQLAETGFMPRKDSFKSQVKGEEYADNYMFQRMEEEGYSCEYLGKALDFRDQLSEADKIAEDLLGWMRKDPHGTIKERVEECKKVVVK